MMNGTMVLNRFPIAALTATMLILGACGGGDDDSSSTDISTASTASAQSSSVASATSSSATSSAAASSVANVAWYSYNADNLPLTSTAITSATGVTSAFTSVSDSQAHMTDTSGILSIDTSTSTTSSYAKFTMPYVSTYPKYITIMARITGNTNSYKASDLEVALSPDASSAGLRVKTIISTSVSTGVQVEKYDGSTSLADKSDTSGTHIYQIAVTLASATTGSFAVYVDGSATPALTQSNVSLRTAGAIGDNYVGFGANSSTNVYQSKIDWIVWTTDGAFTPAQVLGTLPSGLGTTTGY